MLIDYPFLLAIYLMVFISLSFLSVVRGSVLSLCK